MADHDLTWVGLNWLRPAKHQRIGYAYVLWMSFILGLPGVLAGAALLFAFVGRVAPEAWCTLFLLVMALQVPMNLIFARVWNRRARGMTS